MRVIWKDVLISLFMGMVLPGLVLNTVMLLQTEPSREVATVFAGEETVTQSENDAVALPVRVKNPDGTVEDGQMDAYLVGVVLAEMPAYFETEALKAQSVVARTYALKAYITGGKHGDGSICKDPGCCQAYISPQDYLNSGGTEEAVDKVRSAVEETSGYVLTYGGELIEATYFSCSGGSTEDAAAVWGTDYPYLRAVSSPGEEQADHYSDTQTFDAQVFCAALDLSPAGEPEDWFGEMTYTPGGGVDTAVIAGKTFTGTQLRKLLGLRSTAMTMTVQCSDICITTRGFGHRVGMSQYGADAMAALGSSWQEILAHYYPGTTLICCDQELWN